MSAVEVSAAHIQYPPATREEIRTVIIRLLIFALAAVLGLELLCRYFINYRPDYYQSYTNPPRNSDLSYPWGSIHINNDGFPDENFHAVKQKPRVAYVGDSICYGVGVGMPYRISDLLKQHYPQYEHMNLCTIGNGVTQAVADQLLYNVERYRIDKVVLLFNLDDLLPDAPLRFGPPGAATAAAFAGPAEPPVKPGLLKSFVSWFAANADFLRGKSFLYTYVRFAIKNWLTQKGVAFHGGKAHEFFPDQNRQVIVDTAARVRALADALKARGAELIVLLLPYEMQISADAAEQYARMKIQWDGERFLNRGPQEIIARELEGIRVIDAYHAFVDPANVEASRRKYKIGEVFVYNKGDRLDWNHPTREGHKLIADYVKAQQGLD
ncbi:MAG: hypothetical protein GMKNLPBB_01273 [Myxococcota bacterium]|nr:hypothetical protein [Myxococcota bacterium]